MACKKTKKAMDAVMAEFPEIEDLKVTQATVDAPPTRTIYRASGVYRGTRYYSKNLNQTPLGAAHNLVQKIKRATASGGELPGPGGELPGEPRIVPDETVEAPVHQQKPDPSRERVSCPTCDKTFSGAAVSNRPPVMLFGNLVAIRTAYCDHCTRAWSWSQPVNLDGSLSNVTQGVRIESKRFSEKFLAGHPQCAGVAQS